jgi:hypothetical protein
MPAANTSNISTIQILRSYSNSAPLTLDDGQLAYSFVSNTLFIGSNTGVKIIGDPSTAVKSQAAYNQANTATVLANAAYFHANGAFIRANAAFDNSNTKLSLSGGTITGPISGPGESKLDFTTYGSNTVYLTTTNDDSTALFMGAMSAELYANTSVQIRANTKGTSQNWTFGAGGTLTFPDNTIQTTAYTPGGEIDELARATANAAYFHANGAFLKANASFNQANLTIGVDASQNVRLAFSNTRMDISDGVNASQNVRLAFSNTRMDISDGVNTTQNTRLTVIENTDLSQNVRLNFSNTRMDISDGVNASQNSRLDFSNTRMNIIDGVDAGQNSRMTIADGVDASQNSRLDYSNTALTIAQGVDNSQNVRIDYSNAAITIIQGTDTTQNTRLTVIEGTNASQNVRIDYSNAAITIIQGVDVGQNSRMTIADGVDASQNVRLDYSNTAITIIQGVDVTQNTNISNRLALSGASLQTVTGNVVFGNDVTVTGNLIVLGNTISLNVTSIEVEDTLIQLGIGNYSTDALTIGYVGHYNDGTNAHAGMIRDALTKEFYAFQGYTPEVSGNVINVNAASFTKANIHGNWFKGNLIATTARVGGLDVNSRLDFSNTRMTIIEGVDVTQNTNIAATDNKMQGAYNVANTADARSVSAYFHANGAFIRANAAFDAANVVAGGLVTANANTVIIQGVDASQNVRLDFSNTRMTIIEGVDASQNVRLDYSNTRMTIIEGVDASQNVRLDYSNTAINATDGKMQSGYNQANTGTILAQAVFNQANVTIGVDASQNVRLDFSNTAINATDGKMQLAYDQANTGTNLAQAAYNQANVTIGVDASQNVRLDFSNTRIALSEAVDASQNVRLDFSNTAINATDGKMQNAYNTANTADVRSTASYFHANGAFIRANAAFDRANSQVGFARISVSGQPDALANIANAGLTFVAGAGMTITTVGTSNTITFASAGGGVSPSGYLANAVIFANSTGFLSNTTNFQYISSNNTLITGNIITSGSGGNITNANSIFANTFVATLNVISAGVDLLNYTQSAFNVANTSSANTIQIQGVDASQNVRLAFSNTRMDISDGVDASQNVRLAFSNTRMDISDGVNASQNVRLDFSNTAINATDNKMQSAYNQANVTIGVDASQNVRLDFSNTRMTIIEGVDVEQNTRMTVSDGVNASQNVRLDYSNTAITIIQSVDVEQNTRLTVIEGTNASQNVRLDYSNTAITIAQNVDNSQNVRLDFSNARMSIIEDTNLTQNVRLDFSNTRMTIIEGVDVTQNTNIANRLALSGVASQTVSGNVVFGNDVTVTGNLIVLGNTISLNVSSLEVDDSLIQLAIGNYYTDVLSIGYVGHYNDGTNAHAGFIRDAGTKEFYAFQGYTPETTGNVVNINAASFAKANIQGNWFKGNLIATTARVDGLDIKDFSTAAFNQANTGTVLAQAAYSQANGAFIRANAAYDFANTITTFGTIKVSGQPDVIANVTESQLTFVAGSGMTITTVGTSNTITFASSGGGGASLSGYLANTIIVANSTGFLSNSNAFFTASNNTLATSNVYVTNRVGFANANNILVVYQVYNANTNSLDTIFG